MNTQKSSASDATRWVLAFDSSCATCREVSGVVAEACGQALEVLPLNRPDVRGWREERFGSDLPHTPTLIRVRQDGVRVWTGWRIASVLTRRLGLRSTLRVLQALGKLREEPADGAGPSERGMGRATFLRLCVGVTVSTGIILKDSTPAMAGSGDPDRARAWVAAHKSTLPQRYEDVTALPMSYRQEVFKASEPQVRSQLFVQQLSRYRSDHGTGLSQQQRAVLNRAIELASRKQMFAAQGLSHWEHDALEELRIEGTRAFGHDEARALFAALTPPAALGHGVSPEPSDDHAAPRVDPCPCATSGSWCPENAPNCVYGLGPGLACCNYDGEACGTLLQYDCDGVCTEYTQCPP